MKETVRSMPYNAA